MSDSDEELCLKIHLGDTYKGSESSSDSGDDNELDEEYHLLKPSPIPAEVIRQRCIYRPPSPEDEKLINSSFVLNTNHEQNGIITSDEKIFSKKDQQQEAVFNKNIHDFIHVKIARDLVQVQYELHTHVNKLSPMYLKALEEFRVNVEDLEISMVFFKSAKASKPSVSLLGKIVILEMELKMLISHFYAFIISECLLLIRKSYENKKVRNALANRSLNLIRKHGNIEEIRAKINLRNLKTWQNLINDLQISNFIAVQASDDEILTELRIVFPRIRKRGCRGKGKVKMEKEAELQLLSQQLETSEYSSGSCGTETIHKVEHSNIENDLDKNNLSEENNFTDLNFNIKDQHVEKLVQHNLDNRQVVNSKEDSSCGEVKSIMNGKSIKNKRNITIESIEQNKIFHSKPNYNQAYLSHTSTMRQIKYSNMKIICVMNILQYSINTFEQKYSIAAHQTIRDYIGVLNDIDSFNKLLNLSSKPKLQEINKYYIPFSKVIKANFYAQLLIDMCEYLNSVQHEKGKFHSELVGIIDSLGSPQQIWERLKDRNDILFMKLAEKATLIPVPDVPSSNSEILWNIVSIKNNNLTVIELPTSSDNKITHSKDEFRIADEEFIPELKCEVESIKEEMVKIRTLTNLQYEIHHWDEKLDNFNWILKKLQTFVENLKSLEQKKELLNELGSFADKFLDHLNFLLNRHIIKIFISQFYSFLMLTFSVLFKTMSENEVSNFELILLMGFVGSSDEVSEKLAFRNDSVYWKLTSKILKMKGVVVIKSSTEILEEISIIVESLYEDTLQRILGSQTDTNDEVGKINEKSLKKRKKKKVKQNNTADGVLESIEMENNEAYAEHFSYQREIEKGRTMNDSCLKEERAFPEVNVESGNIIYEQIDTPDLSSIESSEMNTLVVQNSCIPCIVDDSGTQINDENCSNIETSKNTPTYKHVIPENNASVIDGVEEIQECLIPSKDVI